MATIKFVLYKSNKRKDGSYPVCLRVSKKGKLKYIDLKLSSLEGQWNEDTCRFKNDKRVNPNYELYNGLLSHYEDRKNTILRKLQNILEMQRFMSELYVCWQSMTRRLRNGYFQNWI